MTMLSTALVSPPPSCEEGGSSDDEVCLIISVSSDIFFSYDPVEDEDFRMGGLVLLDLCLSMGLSISTESALSPGSRVGSETMVSASLLPRDLVWMDRIGAELVYCEATS